MRVIKKLSDFSFEEEQDFNDELNDLFSNMVVAAPGVEIGDTTDGQYVKLRVMPRDEYFSVGELIFELQLKLHIYKRSHPELIDCKLIVSDLCLTNIIPNSTFRRGVMIKMKYDSK